MKNQRQTSVVGNATGFEPVNRSYSQPASSSLIEVLSSGAHFEWIDFEWLTMLAGHPQIQLHIAGIGRGKDFEKLINNNRVRFHNKLSAEQLKQLSLKCDAGVIPFKESNGLGSLTSGAKAYLSEELPLLRKH